MKKIIFIIAALLLPMLTFASEADLKIPTLTEGQNNLLVWGFVICVLGLAFGFYQFMRVRKIRAHKSMLDVST